MKQWMMACLLAALPSAAHASDAVPATQAAQAETEASNNFAYLDYHADYQVNADATHVETDTVEVLIHNKGGVGDWSQVRQGYSEKMETLEILSAYMVTPDGQRHDVPADKIYTQESYSSASAAMYADQKVKVIVFPNLSPGTRLVYSVRRSRNTPRFPGYFGLWETFSRLSEYRNVRVTLNAPANLPMYVHTANGVDGGNKPRVRNGIARWEWRVRNLEPLPSQNWSTSAWEFSPTIMASTYPDYSALGRAYHLKAGEAAQVTPRVQALADEITRGIDDRRAQAAALYEWVARNIRYVAVYLGNGGLEPNTADSILANHYGDCKDHVVILEALLAAKGIVSTPVLIGAGGGPTLPPVVQAGRFNHAITYVPEFDLYLDSTSPHARFGQLPSGDLDAPVVHSADGKVTRTPASSSGPLRDIAAEMELTFAADGSAEGMLRITPQASSEIMWRGALSNLNGQNRRNYEASLMASASMEGRGKLGFIGAPNDLSRPFALWYGFTALDQADFANAGGLLLPDTPGITSIRDYYKNAKAERNDVPFSCPVSSQQETYRLHFPAGVAVIALPRDVDFSNAAGSYQSNWQRDGQTVTVVHRLRQNAVQGEDKLCQPQDYLQFRELYRQIRRGFRAQVVYGALPAAP